MNLKKKICFAFPSRNSFLYYRKNYHFSSKFQEFFKLAIDDKQKSHKLLQYYSLIQRRSHYKMFRNFLLMNVLVIFGLLIIPGSKIGPQYWLKLWFNDIYTDILITISLVHQSEDYLEYVNNNIIDSLLKLSQDGIFEFEYLIKNVNRMNRILEENLENQDLIRDSLLNMGILLNYLRKENIDMFIMEDFQESLLSYLTNVVNNVKFKDSHDFSSQYLSLINETKYSKLIDSYKEIINLVNVLLLYQTSVDERVKVYDMFIQLLQKECIRLKNH